MADFTLTTGSDTVTGTASNDTVNGTAATLNAGDSLTGGAGTDTLALYGSGTFRVDQLATFTGFESITLNNFTSGYCLSLSGQPIGCSDRIWVRLGASVPGKWRGHVPGRQWHATMYSAPPPPIGTPGIRLMAARMATFL